MRLAACGLGHAGLRPGPAFSVAGAPIARDAARVELGADLVVVRNPTAGLSYAGEFGGGSRQHTGSLDLRWRF